MSPQKQLRSQRCMDIIYHIIIISHPSYIVQENRSHYFDRIRLRQCVGCTHPVFLKIIHFFLDFTPL